MPGGSPPLQRGASEGKGEIVNLPQLNSVLWCWNWLRRECHLPILSQKKNIHSDKSNSLIVVDDVACNCNSKW